MCIIMTPFVKKKNIYHWYVISKHSQTDGSDGGDDDDNNQIGDDI